MMNNSCVVIEAENNSFTFDARITIPDLSIYSYTCRCKIDTGCSYSTIPFFRLKQVSRLAMQYKRDDILNSVAYKESYGIETSGIKHERPVSFEERWRVRL